MSKCTVQPMPLGYAYTHRLSPIVSQLFFSRVKCIRSIHVHSRN